MYVVYNVQVLHRMSEWQRVDIEASDVRPNLFAFFSSVFTLHECLSNDINNNELPAFMSRCFLYNSSIEVTLFMRCVFQQLPLLPDA